MANIFRLLSIAVTVLAFCKECKASIYDRLGHFETLHHSQISHSINKRSTSNPKWRTVSLTILNRHFRLELRKQRNLFAKHFEAYTVSSHDAHSTVPIEQDSFYEGFVADEPDTSNVRAHWEGNNLMATIWTNEDTFVIEPSWRHLSTSDKFSMIAYKVSDLKQSGRHQTANTSFCGYVRPDGDGAAYKEPTLNSGHDKYTSDRDELSKQRRRRAVGVKFTNTCPLLLVADYHFYQHVGLNSPSLVASYLIGVISRVDAIYRNTDFGDGYKDIGFEIKAIRIHSEPSGTSGHYNMAADTWDVNNLLTAFSNDVELSSYCLGHLFTYMSFGGVLGLGYIASSTPSTLGGVCCPGSNGYFYNTAWSTTMATDGGQLLTQEADLVTAHEFGHNWGSQHDPSKTTSENCDPSGAEGGKYIMYTYSNSGYDNNNDKFSSCSKSSMLAVLQSRSADCFTERSTSHCGNSEVEDGEECDAGGKSRDGTDACCDKNCKLRTGVVCSDSNDVCCVGCQFAPNTTLCRQSPGVNVSCDNDAYCTGSSTGCPPSSQRSNGAACYEGGSCFNGVCESVCEHEGKDACACDTVADSCFLCCRNRTSRVCSPYALQPTNLPDGRQCTQGFCKAGKCTKSIRKLSDRLWNVIQNIDINWIKLFMKENLVLATIIFSLVIYIPLAIIVACIDCRTDRDDDDDVNWLSKDNEQVIAPGTKVPVQRAYFRRRTQPTSNHKPKNKYDVGPL